MKNVLKALDAAQKEFPAIVKNKTGSTGGRSYKYADLEDVVSGITPTLRKHGLMFVQGGSHVSNQAEHKQILTTTIYHVETGEGISSEIILPSVSDPQDLGIAITYVRRYALCAILGIVTEEDTDGAVKPKDRDFKQPEMPRQDDIPHYPAPATKKDVSTAICPFGRDKGLTFAQIGKPGLAKSRDYWLAKLAEKDEAPKGALKTFLENVNLYLGQ